MLSERRKNTDETNCRLGIRHDVVRARLSFGALYFRKMRPPASAA